MQPTARRAAVIIMHHADDDRAKEKNQPTPRARVIGPGKGFMLYDRMDRGPRRELAATMAQEGNTNS